jgi:uncharacterized protein (TIGR00251 family)
MDINVQHGVVSFLVRVVPRGKRDAIEGEFQGALRVRLTAPPVDNRANDALRRLLSERLRVPVSAVKVVAGARSRTKRVSVDGVTSERVLELVSGNVP